jgi:hypothetical protein
MKTATEKYMYDATYRVLVDHLENLVESAVVTPSEVREAALMACVNYELRRKNPRSIF